jgi:hypothetical protein
MRHPTEGALRRLLDEPAGVATADRDHVAACAQCRDDLTGARDDADLVRAALGPDLLDELDDEAVEVAWQRLTAASLAIDPIGHRSRPVRTRRTRRLRDAVRRPAAAGVAVALVLAGAGAAAANDWLQIFRTEQITTIGVRLDELPTLPDLRAYGDVEVGGEPDVQPVADADEAAARSGLAVPVVAALPRGVAGEPTYRVGDEVSVTFTFSAEAAARAAADAGEPLPAPPAGLDGSQVRLVAGPGVVATWSSGSGLPDLVVGRAAAPRAYSTSGVPFETMRDYLLSLPGLPDDVAAPLRAVNADGSTLPLPVPADEVTTSAAEVDGRPATVLVSRDGAMAAVVWVDGGELTFVAGSLGADEVLTVARGLR